MAINIATKAILKILSFGGIDVEVSRQLADLKRLDPMKIFYKKMDLQVYKIMKFRSGYFSRMKHRVWKKIRSRDERSCFSFTEEDGRLSMWKIMREYVPGWHRRRGRL